MPEATTEELRKELIEIGYRSPEERYVGGQLQGWTWFLRRAKGRAREIGELLYDRGGHDLMLQVHEEVRQALGGSSGRELEVAWDGIGEWQG